MTNTTKSLDAIFDVYEPTPNQPLINTPNKLSYDISSIDELQDQMDDYKQTRIVLNRILIKTETALDEMLEIARSNEKKEDFEAVGKLAETLAKVSDRVLDVHKKMNEIRKKIEKEEGKKVEIQQQNNVVFSGSPSELLDMIKGKS
jgi:prophage DNA circulation protein